MASIWDTEVRSFLQEGAKTGHLGFTASDGRPVVTPVWFLLEDADVVFNTGQATAKAHAIARDPRVTLCVDLPKPPFAFVRIQGMASTSDDPDELLRTATAIGGRYMGADRAEEFGRRNGAHGELVVRIHPSKVNAMFDMVA